MKTKNSIYIALGLLCTLKIVGQTEMVRIYAVNEQNNPVDGVYAGIPYRYRFWYSDTLGIIDIPLSELSLRDTLSLLHISYKPVFIDAQSLISSMNHKKNIQLQSDIKVLDEVTVTPLNPAKLVKEAIRLIPALYSPAFAYPLSLHANIDVFNANDSTSIIYYKGALQISQPDQKKLPCVSKLAEIEQIAGNAKDQLYPIRVSRFAEIIPIGEQGVIRNFKRYVFDKYQYIQYRGSEAVQVYFHREKGDFKQTGSLIIREDTKAIVALIYSTQSMKNVMKSTTKGSMIYTNLDSHQVEINYSLNADNLYEFESGMYHVQYTNHRKNTFQSIILNSYLKKITSTNIETGSKIPVNELFIKE
ncbi:MAG: hypothetical protein LBJ60_02940 [Tannerellaceae bacterium]|jgi:hypothetical protein|nr:hypothetical protein [Tannerellaceae bacterium]